eukprot:40845-Chlamydomonas_euryale.AAC.2
MSGMPMPEFLILVRHQSGTLPRRHAYRLHTCCCCACCCCCDCACCAVFCCEAPACLRPLPLMHAPTAGPPVKLPAASTSGRIRSAAAAAAGSGSRGRSACSGSSARAGENELASMPAATTPPPPTSLARHTICSHSISLAGSDSSFRPRAWCIRGRRARSIVSVASWRGVSTSKIVRQQARCTQQESTDRYCVGRRFWGANESQKRMEGMPRQHPASSATQSFKLDTLMLRRCCTRWSCVPHCQTGLHMT